MANKNLYKVKRKTSKKTESVEFTFYYYLNNFYRENRKKILSTYKPITKKFLDYNDPLKPNPYLRLPQYEALEMYIFLKEFLDNEFMSKIFEDWFFKRNKFQGRIDTGETYTGQTLIFAPLESDKKADLKKFELLYKEIDKYRKTYPNYIYALTMGLGKTVLMATSIFYEFILANKYPDDPKYCHNALVFAPDKTVLQSLKEIITMDKSKVIPSEYISWLDSHIKFHFLDESGDTLNTLDKSSYNVIISNTQKIILKKQHKRKSISESLFENDSHMIKIKKMSEGFEDLYEFEADAEIDLLPNQRFTKLTRLKNLGVYVDEAHHVFGTSLEKDMLNSESSTSLRLTINQIAKNLGDAGTKVIACYNYTGTPYSKKKLLPEVVYSYGLRDAIDNKYLKKVTIKDFKNIKEDYKTFIKASITEFWTAYKRKRYEGMIPKMAIFSPTIKDLQNKLKPVVEDVLSGLGIPLDSILVNVGDSSITSNDDIREFISLDSKESKKQFILLVNKGKEGWNCRSLFSVAMMREPKSKVFVLQATMRCLRYIGNLQETAQVFLSEANLSILNKELEENFKVSVDQLNNAGAKKKIEVQVKLVPPPIKVKLKKELKLFKCEEKTYRTKIDFELEKIDYENYKIIERERNLKNISKEISQKDITHLREKIEYSELTLTSEIAKYLNFSPVKINKILNNSKPDLEEILKTVNEYNVIIYDVLIPKIFNHLFEIKDYSRTEEFEIELVKEPIDGNSYRVSADPDLVANYDSKTYKEFKNRSFHLDNYCFDSEPERKMFGILLKDKKVDKVWFTGMLTHGQTEFFISYIDPESHSVRSYYPDFLVKNKDKSYKIIEVKADHLIDDSVVQAKAEFARQLCKASDFEYVIIRSSDIMRGGGYPGEYKQELLMVAQKEKE